MGIGFDSVAYLAANPDVAAAGMDALQHYQQYGQAEGRSLGVPAYATPQVSAGNSAAEVAYMYRNYADQMGGDTEANRLAAIQYLKNNGVDDATIGSAYQSYLAKGGYQAPVEATPYMAPAGMGGAMFDTRTPATGSPGGGMGNDPVSTTTGSNAPAPRPEQPISSPITSGLIPSYQSSRSQSYTPATPSPLQLTQVSASRVSNPAVNANAVSAVSGQPLNQSRFINAAQPTNTGLLSMADTESYLREMRARALANPNNVATVDRRSY